MGEPSVACLRNDQNFVLSWPRARLNSGFCHRSVLNKTNFRIFSNNNLNKKKIKLLLEPEGFMFHPSGCCGCCLPLASISMMLTDCPMLIDERALSPIKPSSPPGVLPAGEIGAKYVFESIGGWIVTGIALDSLMSLSRS